MIKKNWHNEIVYQIYPKSFLDTSGNGFGDLRGIISKLDYFNELGVTCLWLSPVFESPMKDNGYDISDYRKIDPIFGKNEDMYELIEKAKEKGIKIILDLVVNHTSDQHEWFKQAKSSKDNKYRDYYIWSDKKNELESIFLGDAWEFDNDTSQYYFHLFAKEQPDLNWDNEELRKEIYEMMNFWIKKGVGGFRIDVIEFLGKEPFNLITADGPNLHKYINEMNLNTFGKSDLITVGESWSATNETQKLYTDPSRKELSMIFRFDHITQYWDEKYGKWMAKDFELSSFKNILFSNQKDEFREYWNTLFWGNHDLPRSVTTYIDSNYRVEGSKMMISISMFLSGTPFIYQGEEIGMTNIELDVSEYKDIEAINAYKMLINEGFTYEETTKTISKYLRDNARTPMQWNSTLNAGFSQNKPWIKVNKNYTNINVDDSLKDNNSILNYYKKIIKLRKNLNDTILYGSFRPLHKEDNQLFAFERELDDTIITVIANFSNKEKEINMKYEKIIINNYDSFDGILKPYQVLVLYK